MVDQSKAWVVELLAQVLFRVFFFPLLLLPPNQTMVTYSLIRIIDVARNDNKKSKYFHVFLDSIRPFIVNVEYEPSSAVLSPFSFAAQSSYSQQPGKNDVTNNFYLDVKM